MEMKLKKCFSAVLAALSVIAMYSCDKVKNTESNPSLSSETTETSDVSATTDTTAATEPMTTFTQAAVSTQKISKKDFYGLYEAEYAKLSDGLRVSFERDDYNGDGYVTGFRNGSTVTFGINAVSAQHYDLSFCIASAAVTDCGIKLNGNDLTSFKTQEGGAFTYITIYGVFLEKGDSDVELSVSGENVDLDYLKVAESEVHSEKNSKIDNIFYSINHRLDISIHLFPYFCYATVIVLIFVTYYSVDDEPRLMIAFISEQMF